MKKTLIAVAAAAALFMASAAAEVTFGAWINTLWAPVASDGDDIYSDAANSWGGYRQARFNIDGKSEDEKAGVHVDAYVNNQELVLGDWAYIWAQPIDQIKILMGQIDDGYLGTRGDFAYGSWNWYRPANFIAGDEGLTFSAPAGCGVLLDIAPVDIVHIYGWAPVSGSGAFADTAEKVYGNADVIVTANIVDIAKVKLGWFGKYGFQKDEDNKAYQRYGDIEVAVDLTIIDPLYITVGFQYRAADSGYWDNAWINGISDDDTENGLKKDLTVWGATPRDNYFMKIAAGVSYQIIDMLKVSVSGGVFFYDSKYYDVDPTWQIGGGVDLDLGQFVPGLGLLGDVRYMGRTKASFDEDDYSYDVKFKDDAVSFMIGATYSLGSNAMIGVAFQGVTNGSGFDYHGILVPTDENGKVKDNFCWAVPIRLNVWL